MTITLDIPGEAEQTLRDIWGQNLDQAALEALVIQGYRSGKVGLEQVRRLLGFESRWDVEEWLGQRGVTWNYSLEDLEEDRKALSSLSTKRHCCSSLWILLPIVTWPN
jgi:predicted HTH domain antitoxin